MNAGHKEWLVRSWVGRIESGEEEHGQGAAVVRPGSCVGQGAEQGGKEGV